MAKGEYKLKAEDVLLMIIDYNQNITTEKLKGELKHVDGFFPLNIIDKKGKVSDDILKKIIDDYTDDGLLAEFPDRQTNEGSIYRISPKGKSFLNKRLFSIVRNSDKKTRSKIEQYIYYLGM